MTQTAGSAASMCTMSGKPGNPHQSSECTTPLRPAGERNRAVGSRAAASAAFTVTWLRDEAAATKIVV